MFIFQLVKCWCGLSAKRMEQFTALQILSKIIDCTVTLVTHYFASSSSSQLLHESTDGVTGGNVANGVKCWPAKRKKGAKTKRERDFLFIIISQEANSLGMNLRRRRSHRRRCCCNSEQQSRALFSLCVHVHSFGRDAHRVEPLTAICHRYHT